MKVAVMFSGGKDSTRTAHWCIEKGYDVKCLLTFVPSNKESYMFHSVNLNITKLLAKSMSLPIKQFKVSGIKEIEVEEMKKIIEKIDVDAIACGGIKSDYQKQRIKNACDLCNKQFIAPFWHYDEEKFLRELVDLKFDVIIVSVSSFGLTKQWLGRKLNHETIDELIKLNKKYGLSIVFEGGEGETLVLDAPMFKKRIKILETRQHWDEKTSSGHLEIIKAKLENK
ncbi:MAG: TIGR00289 family protein [Candidatus Aenigmatarchaeota archaeon]|nr:TIGR00289 family protein [Candidatus Aenigmarchaeota archaeon]